VLFRSSANISNTPLSTENLAALGKAPALSNLNLRQVPLTKENLAGFGGATITYLYLFTTGIDGDALATLERLPSMTRLTLNEPKLTDDALPGLKKLKKLTSLSLQNTKITAEGEKELVEALKPCRVSMSPRRK
jgi:Leucine-rich repeat (LRR) protein